MPYMPCSAVAKMEVTTAPPPPPPPAEKGVIYGWVRDAKTRKPISGVSITINGYTATTDEKGYYEVSVSPGDYTVTAKKSGYRGARKKVSVGVGERVECSFYLTPVLAVPSWWWFVVALGVVSVGVVAVTLWRKRVERARVGFAM